MSIFSTLFADAYDALAGCSGEAVSYQPAVGDPIAEPAAIVGNETVEERSTKSGLVKVRVREFSLRRSLIAEPLQNATVAYGGEAWPIKGVAAQDQTYTRVRCELPQLRDGSKGGVRPHI